MNNYQALDYHQFCQSQQKLNMQKFKITILKDCILLGIFNLLLVTTFMSFSNIVSYIYKHKQAMPQDMGSIILATNYGAFMVFNSLVPSLPINYVNMMKIASLAYAFNYLTEAFQQPGTLGVILSVLGAFVGGVGASFLNTSYGGYMKSLLIFHQEQENTGKYFAIVNGITFSALLLGPLITTFGLGLFSNTTYFIILISITIFAFFFCSILIRKVEKMQDGQNQQISSGNCNCNSIFEIMVRNIGYYIRMKHIIFVIAIDGICLAFSSNFNVLLLPEKTSAVAAGMFLVVMGVGATAGSVLSGYLCDRMKLKNVGLIGLFILLLTLISTEAQTQNMDRTLAFVVSFLWGFVIYWIEGWMLVVCSIVYQGRLQSFANVKQLHSLFFCLYHFTFVQAHNSFKVEYVIAFLMLLIPLSLFSILYLPPGGQSYTLTEERNSPQSEA